MIRDKPVWRFPTSSRITNRFGAFKAVTDSETNFIVGPTVEARAAYNSTFATDDATELFEFLRRGDKVETGDLSDLLGHQVDIMQRPVENPHRRSLFERSTDAVSAGSLRPASDCRPRRSGREQISSVGLRAAQCSASMVHPTQVFLM